MSTRTRKPRAVTAQGPRAQHPSRAERDAGRRYLEHSHAAATLKGKPAQAAERNAQAIDEEHEHARDIALTGTARELGQLPPHLRAHQRSERQLAGISTDAAARIRAGYRRPPAAEPDDGGEPPTPSRATRVLDARPASAAAGYASEAADTSVGQLIVQVFSWGLALSLGYLLLTRAAAVGKLFQGAANTTRAIVSATVDPLNPHGA